MTQIGFIGLGIMGRGMAANLLKAGFPLTVHNRSRGKVDELVAKAHMRWCLERGYRRLEWWVLDWNEPAIEVYRRMGAVAMDEWTVYRVSGPALRTLAEGPEPR